MNIAVIILLAILVIAGAVFTGFLLFTPYFYEQSILLDDVAANDYWTIGGIQELSFAHTGIACTATSQLQYKQDGSWRIHNLATVPTHVFSPESASITRYGNSGGEVTDFLVLSSLKCQLPDIVNKLELTGGSDRYYFSSSPGALRSNNFSTIPSVDSVESVETTDIFHNRGIITSTHEFTADQLESYLRVDSATGLSVLKSVAVHEYDFVIHAYDSQSQVVADGTPTFSSFVYMTLEVTPDYVAPIDLPASPSFEPIEVTSVKTAPCNNPPCSTGTELLGGIPMDTTGSIVRQIIVTGIMQDYDPREAPPQIQILQPNALQLTKQTMHFDKMIGDDAQWYMITYMPREAVNGEWTVKMLHDTRSTSTRSFTVQNTAQTPANPITNPTAPDSFNFKLAIGYTHKFNPIVSGVTTMPVIDTGILDRTSSNTITSLDILNSQPFTNVCLNKQFDSDVANLDCGDEVEAGSKKLEEIRLYPLVLPGTPEEAFTIRSVKVSDIDADISISVGGKQKDIKTYNVIISELSSAASIQCGATDINGGVDADKCLAYLRGISLGRALIPVRDIELSILTLGLDLNKQHALTINANLAGDFTLQAKDGSTYSGSFSGLQYTWTAIYQDAGFDGLSCNSSNSISNCCPAGTVPLWNADTNSLNCDDDSCGTLGTCDVPPADRDRDGTADEDDDCPNVIGLVTNNGCPLHVPPPDEDGDGILDGKDVCPLTVGTVANQGCPEPNPRPDPNAPATPPAPASPNAPNGVITDTDNDSIADSLDLCPNVQGVLSQNGCPLKCKADEIKRTDGTCQPKSALPRNVAIDTDGDGIVDEVDKCPDVTGFKKNNGCPTPEAEEEADEETDTTEEDDKDVDCEGGGVCDDESEPEGKSQKMCFDTNTGDPIECEFELDDLSDYLPDLGEHTVWIIGGVAVLIVILIVKGRQRQEI